MKKMELEECFILKEENISVKILIKGNFLNGKRSGEGMFTYANKDIYSGNWLNGKKHGKGTYVFFDTQSRVYFLNFSMQEIILKAKSLKEIGFYQIKPNIVGISNIINQMDKVYIFEF